MAIALSVTPSYFIMKDEAAQRPPVSQLEISGMYNPQYMGKIIAEDMDRGSLIAQLLIEGKELQASTRQVVWKEESTSYSRSKVEGDGLVSRSGNDFVVNTAAIPADPNDLDSNRPEDAQWIVKEGMTFVTFDSTGKKDSGVITAISEDGKTFTATSDTGSWTIGTSNIGVYFTGYNLDNCECPPCVGWKTYNPTRSNVMTKDGECVSYCEETDIEERAGAFDRFEIQGGYMSVDKKLDDKQKALIERMEHTIAFGNIKGGTKGVFTILEGRAKKVEGTIDTIDDLHTIAKYLNEVGVHKATIRCSYDQLMKLQKLVSPTSPYFYSPFENHQTDLVYLGFGGIKIGNVELIFKEWSVFSSYVGKKYNFIIIPEGRLTRQVNGRSETVGYVNICWFGGNGKVWKFLRTNNENEHNCGQLKYDLVNKFTPLVFHPEKFILGVNV